MYLIVNCLDSRSEFIDTVLVEEIAFRHTSSASRVTMMWP